MRYSVILIGSLLSAIPAFAGKLYIHNTTDQPIQFRFIPQIDNGTPDYNYSVAQNSIREITVGTAMFDDKTIYAIEGETRFGGDSCFNLYADRNYKIYFKKVNFGTACEVKEIRRKRGRLGFIREFFEEK